MSEDPQELRSINWAECFGFSNIFRTFRLAIHPAKLILALGIVVATCLIGVLMDAATKGSAGVIPNEIHAFHRHRNTFDTWHKGQARAEATELAELMHSELKSSQKPDDLVKQAEGDRPQLLLTAGDKLDALFKDRLTESGQIESAGDEFKEMPEDERRALVNERIAQARKEYREIKDRLAGYRARGIFIEWIVYQKHYFNAMLKAAVTADVFSGFDRIGKPSHDADVMSPLEDIGVLACLCMMGHGEAWMLSQHPLYALVFVILSLPIWALLAGALCRIVALHATRDERISIAKGIKFSSEKFISFVFAPLIPMIVVLVIGLMLIIGGFVMNGWAVDILSGLFFFLALIGGAAIAFMLIGGTAGLALMWPTIAVEGSDSFDALSRSFTYVLQRPWKALFYSGIALIYGSACTLFVRLFAFLMLTATHVFVGIGVYQDRPQAGAELDKLDVMWQAPAFDALRPVIMTDAVSGTERITAFLIQLWVYLIPTLVYAFIISFFFSAATVIYILLRREVDATDLNDVYLDEYADEDFQSDDGPSESGKPDQSAPGGMVTPTIGQTNGK
jgi:hypothetical protein